MVFSSTVFMFIFLPVVYLLYMMCPNIKIKNFLLTVVSLLFYAFGEPKAILIMLISILINYILGILISKSKDGKPILILGVVLNLGILCVFKYLNFIVSIIGSVANVEFNDYHTIALPIGISFFTFQAMSYIVDVYRDKSIVQKNLLNLTLYISFFPQLIAGPIIKYYDMEYQIHSRTISVDKTALGIKRFIFGLAKKLLISNSMGYIADTIFALDSQYINILSAWVGGIAYTLQIYFDFSGYSDMAIGLSKVFGFDFKENFNYPYIATSIKDFWRRWHISLSTWFKEYLYIPLGGNRKGSLRTNLNRLFVFFCTGLWHGANFTFIVWGLMHGLLLTLEHYSIIPIDKCKFKPLKHIYTMLCVIVTFVMFRADTVSKGLLFIKSMFVGYSLDISSISRVVELFTPTAITSFVVAIVFSMPIGTWINSSIKSEKSKEVYSIATYGCSLILIGLCIINLSNSGYNPFIYFQF